MARTRQSCAALLTLASLVSACLPGAAWAEIYKWVDEDGNVTYLDKPPPAGQGKVEKKKIDPNQNLFQGRKLTAPSTGAPAATSPPSPPPEDETPTAPDRKKLPAAAVGDTPDEASTGAPSPLAPVPPPAPTPPPSPAPLTPAPVNPPGMP